MSLPPNCVIIQFGLGITGIPVIPLQYSVYSLMSHYTTPIKFMCGNVFLSPDLGGTYHQGHWYTLEAPFQYMPTQMRTYNCLTADHQLCFANES